MQGNAAMALYHLSFASINKGKLIKAGAVPIFLHVLEEESRLREQRSLIVHFGCCSAICKGHGTILFFNLASPGTETPLVQSFGPGMY